MKILVLKYPEFANGPAIGHAIARRYELREFYPSRYLHDLWELGDPFADQLQPYEGGDKLVPDSIVEAAAVHFVEANKHVQGFLFSFFPYHAVQAEWLDAMLAERGWEVGICFGFDPGQPTILETLDMFVEVSGNTTREQEIERYSKSMEYFLEVTNHYKAKGVYRNIRGWADVEAIMGGQESSLE